MLEVAQLVEALDCDSSCCGFDSHPSTQYIPLVLAAARVSPKHQGGVQIPGGMPLTGCMSVGRRPHLGCGGRRFKSCHSDHFYQFKYPLIQKRRLLYEGRLRCSNLAVIDIVLDIGIAAMWEYRYVATCRRIYTTVG